MHKSALMFAPRVYVCIPACDTTLLCDGEGEDDEEAWGGVVSGREVPSNRREHD